MISTKYDKSKKRPGVRVVMSVKVNHSNVLYVIRL